MYCMYVCLLQYICILCITTCMESIYLLHTYVGTTVLAIVNTVSSRVTNNNNNNNNNNKTSKFTLFCFVCLFVCC